MFSYHFIKLLTKPIAQLSDAEFSELVNDVDIAYDILQRKIDEIKRSGRVAKIEVTEK